MNKRRFSTHSLILVTVLAVLIVLAMPTALLGLSIGRRALGDPHGVQSTAAMQQDAQAVGPACNTNDPNVPSPCPPPLSPLSP
ncbi:hypothetical protein DAI22_10g085900 [Oryza sativa Japonica Group]|nr:hypothetical protein DAI22_10g085900 [Oryza sativa Japonica Group]